MLDDGALRQALHHRSNDSPSSSSSSVGLAPVTDGTLLFLKRFYFILQERRKRVIESVGSDTAESTENTTMLVQMKEEKRAFRALPFVTKLSFVRAVKEFGFP